MEEALQNTKVISLEKSEVIKVTSKLKESVKEKLTTSIQKISDMFWQTPMSWNSSKCGGADLFGKKEYVK